MRLVTVLGRERQIQLENFFKAQESLDVSALILKVFKYFQTFYFNFVSQDNTFSADFVEIHL